MKRNAIWANRAVRYSSFYLSIDSLVPLEFFSKLVFQLSSSIIGIKYI